MIKRLFNVTNKSLKYTCSCCGYKTLIDNGIGEICQVCYWEEDYISRDDLFEYSDANYCTLYEAQENYKIFGACHIRIKQYCRKPCKEDLKDANWIPLQTRIENLYKDKLQILQEVESLIKQLSFSNAQEIYTNFKSLPDILIFNNEHFHEWSCANHDDNIYKKQLQLKALSVYLMKTDNSNMINLLSSYYNKSLNYYIGWSIMLAALLNKIPPVINGTLNNLLIDIEAHDFYGLDSMRNIIDKYWLEQKVNS